ncbi:alanine racemase [Jiangella anatolica]|uniref:Alanine racemase n=1 Tax=Jiangella anatolica TaxID=2670374 RepID=A0A2W2C470_9ACTN|nr:alanine racemase [Jiangella anatolica]
MAAAERNIDRMARLVAGTEVRLRPHYKAHKCPELMRRQLAAPGTAGAACQTVAEAAELAALGCADVLLTNQLADPRRVAELLALPPEVDLGVLVDRPEQVDLLGAGAAAARRRVRVFVELDVGLRRGGFDAADPDVAVAVGAIEEQPWLELAGVQAYEGHAVLEPDVELRHRRAADAHALAGRFRDRLARLAGRPLVLTGGGTGTADLIAATGALDEIQCGSYVLMDAAYGRLGLPFEAALFCVATALSAHPDGRVVLDAGMKSLSGDGLPRALTPGVRVLGLSDEHTRARQAATVLRTGDRLLLQPWHVDPTMNLHDAVVVVEDGRTHTAPIRGRHAVRAG